MGRPFYLVFICFDGGIFNAGGKIMFEKQIRKIIFDKILSALEGKKNETMTDKKTLDLFNSGVMLDIEKIRRASLDLAIRVVRIVQEEINSARKPAGR